MILIPINAVGLKICILYIIVIKLDFQPRQLMNQLLDLPPNQFNLLFYQCSLRWYQSLYSQIGMTSLTPSISQHKKAEIQKCVYISNIMQYLSICTEHFFTNLNVLKNFRHPSVLLHSTKPKLSISHLKTSFVMYAFEIFQCWFFPI